MSKTKDTISKSNSKGKKTEEGKASSPSSGKKGSFFSRLFGKKSDSATSSGESGAPKEDSAKKSGAKKAKPSAKEVSAVGKKTPQIEGRKISGEKSSSSEIDTAGKDKKGAIVPPRESAEEKESVDAKSKGERKDVDPSRSDSSVAIKSGEKADQRAPSSVAKSVEGQVGDDSQPQQIKQKDILSGKDASGGKDVSAGKDMPRGGDASSGQGAPAGKDIPSVKDASAGSDISAEKDIPSGKDISAGKDAFSGKSVSVETGASSGKDTSGGKDIPVGKDASGSKGIPAGKGVVSNMKKEDPAPKAGPETTSRAKDSEKQPTAGEVTIDGADQETSRAKDSKKKPALDPSPTESVELQGLFAFKMSMTTFYDEKGTCIPVTALQYKPWIVSQIKTKEKEGYGSVQLACHPQKNNRCSRAQIKHLAPAGFKEGARYVREIRQELTEDIQVGKLVSITGLKKGDRVKISSRSKGRGFSGVVKRWGFHGGRASHGSKTHRSGGAIGQHTEPARVMPGRKMAGRYGFQKTTLHSVPVVDVLPDEGLIFVKGPVPGARNTLVSLEKMERSHA